MVPERKRLMATTHGLKPEEVLCALYSQAQSPGCGALNRRSGGLTLEEARSVLSGGSYIDYLKGRVMKVDLGRVDLDEYLYDRDNGPGAAQRALDDYFTSTPQERDAKYHAV